MNVQIDSILKTFKTEISFYQPIFEAIANSIEADASEIKIVLKSKDSLLNENYISEIIVSDNGEGFTAENTKSFQEYMSSHKLLLGCKGVGRFTWLKIFNRVKIESFNSENYTNFTFDKKFNENTPITFDRQNDQQNKTSIIFSDIIQTKHREINLELNSIKKLILEYFYLKLLNYKKNNSQLTILISDGTDNVIISLDDIEELENKTFIIKDDLNNCEYKFDLDYHFSNEINGKSECFLCGNQRVIEEFDVKKILGGLPEKNLIKILVYSNYFDDRINSERTSFTFSKTDNNRNFTDPIPFNEIKEKIEETIEKLIIGKFPSLSDDNQNVLNECIEEKPYLAKYIKRDSSLIKRKKDVISYAEKQFQKEKSEIEFKFKKMIDGKNLDSEKLLKSFSELNDISNRELAQYFLYRQNIINGLSKLNDDNEKIEKLLHSLFLPCGETTTNSSNIVDKYNNCIWLLDDKFMSYKNMFSDTKVKTIKKLIREENNNDYDSDVEPDLTIFYSNNDLVVVEFKAIGTTTDNKVNAFTELNRNIGIICKNFENINNVYGYIITKFDDKFKTRIIEQPNVTELFTNGSEPTYYFYNGNIRDMNGNKKNVHCYIISTETIYKDADSRNKFFIDIIKNN